jgi:hypothetical protein
MPPERTKKYGAAVPLRADDRAFGAPIQDLDHFFSFHFDPLSMFVIYHIISGLLYSTSNENRGMVI